MQLLCIPDVPETEVYPVSGELLQRWVLKTLIAHGLADILRQNGLPYPMADHGTLVDLAFSSEPWPARWGLYIARSLSQPLTLASVNSPFSGLQPLVHRDGYVIGGIVHLGGMALVLTLFPPHAGDTEGPLVGAIYRPAAVQFRIEGSDVVKGVVLSWNDAATHEPLFYSAALSPVPPDQSTSGGPTT